MVTDYRQYANIGRQSGAGLLSGFLNARSAQGQTQLQQDAIDRQQQQQLIGGLKSGINTQRLNDPAYVQQVAEQNLARQNASSAPSLGSFGNLVQYTQSDEFKALPDDVKQNVLDRINSQSKGVDTLQQQAFATAQGKGQAELGYKPELARETELQKNLGKTQAASIESLESQTSKLPELQGTIDKLRDLSNIATYTYAGQGRDIVARQLGKTTEGAKARTEYEAIVNNQILPLLRDTFGAAFTVQEGESLKATLGAPNKSPEEKQAVLDAFMNQKLANVRAGQRQTGQVQQQAQPAQQVQEESNIIEWGDL